MPSTFAGFSPSGSSVAFRIHFIGASHSSVLARSTKVKMFGFIKNLLRKAPEKSAENYEDTASEPVVAVDPQPAAKPPVFKAPPLRKNTVPVNGNGKGIDLTLQGILQGLPLELQPRVRRTDVGDASIIVPLEKVLAQLSRGAVKVSFGELRQAAPDVFTAQNDRDRVLVTLPLAEILSKLNPALIARRRVQRQVEVPAEISSPFDSHGVGLAFSVGSGRADIAQAPAAPTPPRVNSSVPPSISAPPRANLAAVPPPSISESETPAQAPRFKVPVAPAPPAAPVPVKANLAQPAHAAPVVPAVPAAPAAAPAASARPPVAFNPKPTLVKPVSPIDPTPIAQAPSSAPPAAPVPIALPKPVAPVLREPTPVPAPIAAAPVAAPQPTPAGKTAPGAEPLIVSLASLAEAWPEDVRKEIITMNLAEAKVGLPSNAIEQALKQGRICFSWKTIRSWVRPAVAATASANDSVVVDLPLKVVAPLFLERQREAAKSKQKVSIDEDIPNLFFGFPQPDTGAAAATARPADTNFYVWDDSGDTARIHESEVKRGPSPGTKFVAKYATPNEVVSRAAGLDGVAGALIALPDGLMVANRLPPDLNADTLAAFLPQIFGKVSQCTKELRMGDLNNLNFTVGNVPWKIFRVNAIFFAAFGQPGVPLPTAQLAALAAELDHKPK